MNYALGSSFNLDDMFMNFNNNKLSISCKECYDVIKSTNRTKLAGLIFKESYKLVLLDIIDNNVHFELPTGSKKSDLHIERTSDEDFYKARKNGKYKDIDFLTSMFSGYDIGLYMYGLGRTRRKNVYLDKNYKLKLVDNVNDGKNY